MMKLLGPCPMTASDMVDSVPAPDVEQEDGTSWSEPAPMEDQEVREPQLIDCSQTDAGGSSIPPAASATGQGGHHYAEIVTPPAAVLQFKSKMSPVHKFSPPHQVFLAQQGEGSRGKMPRIEREEAPYLWPTLDETASAWQDKSGRPLDAQAFSVSFSASEGLSRYLHGPQVNGHDRGAVGDSKQMPACFWRPRDPREYAESEMLHHLHRGELPAQSRQGTHSASADAATCEGGLSYQAAATEAHGDGDDVRARVDLSLWPGASRHGAPPPLSYTGGHPTFFSGQAGTGHLGDAGHEDASETAFSDRCEVACGRMRHGGAWHLAHMSHAPPTRRTAAPHPHPHPPGGKPPPAQNKRRPLLPKCAGDRPMVCSYQHCPNPRHTSGGSWKFVSSETRAGNKDWSQFLGRLFCNACFTQYATKGVLERLTRQSQAPPSPRQPSGTPCQAGWLQGTPQSPQTCHEHMTQCVPSGAHAASASRVARLDDAELAPHSHAQ